MTTKANAIIRSVFSLRLTDGLLLTILAAGALMSWWMVGSARRELCVGHLLSVFITNFLAARATHTG